MPSAPIAIQAGLVMPGASAYALTAASLTPVITLPYEQLASYNWVFGTDSSDLSDLISGAKLQQNIALALNGNNGSGYEASGVLEFTGGGATTQATGMWFATAGAISGVYIISPGAGYVTAPTVKAITSSGTGAVVTATLGGSGALGTSSIVLSAASGTGLITPVTESRDQTLCAVIKVNKSSSGAGNPSPVFGTLFAGSSPSGLSGGSGLFLQGTNATIPGYVATTRPGSAIAASAPAGVADGGYAFVAMSEATAGDRLVYWGGPAPTTYTAKQAKNMLATPPKIAIGQGYYAGTGFGLEIAELICIPRSTTASELDAVYARSKARMAARPTPVAVY
ncbi:hypothetical protein [Sphingomonas sp. NFX23]|uniref:hypothetical protein n=1 Tax=Sphingomonas sp. NFX23 TaxID=2819532 RepID=UPI003CE91A05